MMLKGWNPNPTRTGILKGGDTRELCLLTHRGRDIWKHSVEAATCKSERERSHQKPSFLTPNCGLSVSRTVRKWMSAISATQSMVFHIETQSIVIHTHTNICVCLYECIHINVWTCVNVWFCVTRKNFSSFLK